MVFLFFECGSKIVFLGGIVVNGEGDVFVFFKFVMNFDNFSYGVVGIVFSRVDDGYYVIDWDFGVNIFF